MLIDRTQAEEAIIENFLNSDSLPNLLFPREMREAAMAAFKEHGFPSRKRESWHYTDLRNKLTRISSYSDDHNDGRPILPLILGNVLFSVVNGKAVSNSVLPPVFCTPLALSPSRALNILRDFSITNVISQVNTAFASDGWRINVQKDVFLDNIIEIQNLQNGGQSHTCFSVSVAEDSRATILERQLGDDQESFLSSVSDIDLAEGAEVLWIIIRERGILSTELNRFYARLDKGARLKLVIINAGLHLLRQEVHIDLNGSRSDFQLRCINLLSGESHADTTMKIRHFARSTTSKEMIRNIATDTSCGVFQGMVQVLPTGQKTDAKMLCQSLILSKDAECHAKPELDIFADDILCGHGATFSTIDRNQLFYLMTRGLTFVQAKAVLVKCFIKEQIEGIGQEDIEKALHGVLDHWLFLHL